MLGARSEMRVEGSKEERIAQIAGVQRGHVSRAQLIAAGVSRDAIASRLGAGHLIRVHPGVYAVGHRAPTPLGPETAVLLACRDGTVLSHRSAAAIWGLARAGRQIHVTVEGERTTRLPTLHLHRTRHLPPTDVRIHERLPLTSPARTLLDLAPVLSPRELERAYDEALIRRLTTPAQLRELLHRAGPRPGTPLLHDLAGRASTTRTRSEAEERLLTLIRAAELQEPEVNVQLHGYEVDFLWRARGLVVEVDGFAYHSTRAAFERDHRRDADLRSRGLSTLRVTAGELERHPHAVIARLAAALATPLR